MNLPLNTPNHVTPASYGEPCPLCGALCGDAYLCPQCVERLECQLGDVQMLMHQLDITITRQDSVYRPQPPATAEADTPAPFNIAASDARTRLAHTIETTAVMLIRHTGVHWEWGEDIVFIARWIAINTATLAKHPDGAVHAAAIRDAHRQAVSAIDGAEERILAGLCPCGTPLLAPATTVRALCRNCGTTTPTVEAHQALMRHLDGELFTVSGLHTLTKTLAIAVPKKHIENWTARGTIPRAGTSSDGHATYRATDLINHLKEKP